MAPATSPPGAIASGCMATSPSGLAHPARAHLGRDGLWRTGGNRRALGIVSAEHHGKPRSVLNFAGDGGLHDENGQELATAVQYRAGVLFVVFNNSMYGTIRMHQEKTYPARVSGTDLHNPDFAALARAYGAHERDSGGKDGRLRTGPAARPGAYRRQPACRPLIELALRRRTLLDAGRQPGSDAGRRRWQRGKDRSLQVGAERGRSPRNAREAKACDGMAFTTSASLALSANLDSLSAACFTAAGYHQSWQ